MLEALILVLLLPVFAFGSAYAKDNSIRLLQRAYQRGEIDYQTALNYKVRAIFNKAALPPEYQSDAPIKTGTYIIREAKRNRQFLDKENSFILQRPTDPTETSPGHPYGSVSLQHYYSPGGHFTITWTYDTNSYSDAISQFPATGGVPNYVINLANYLEQAWTQEVTTLGYPSPIAPGTRMDVYLLNMSAYGYTNTDNNGIPYIVIENDFVDLDPTHPVFRNNLASDTLAGAMEVTTAHEFFHTIQLTAYNPNDPDIWWMEATATWMEDFLHSDVKDYLNYLGRKFNDANDNGKWDSGETIYQIDGVTPYTGNVTKASKWFDQQSNSLDTFDPTGIFQYGTAIWAKYLTGVYGNGIIQSIWQRIGKGAGALQAVSDELASRGSSLASAYRGMETALYERDAAASAIFPDLASYYPIVMQTAAYTSYPQTASGALNHMATR
ncbi:MAG TPA: MXAN_6640 family putative metalloprotease, partial [Dissulfurispiraceae bacterium]